jgi:P-type Cu+ transporter
VQRAKDACGKLHSYATTSPDPEHRRAVTPDPHTAEHAKPLAPLRLDARGALGRVHLELVGRGLALAAGVYAASTLRDSTGRLLGLGCALLAWPLVGGALSAWLRRAFRALPRRQQVLASLLPSHAARLDAVVDDLRAAEETRVPLDAVEVGDLVRVRPREPIPVDAVVVDGRSAVDELRLTGEPLPLDKRPGSQVLGGSRNGRGALIVRAQKRARDGVLAGILDLLDGAEHVEVRATQRARAEATAQQAVRLAIALVGGALGAVAGGPALGALCAWAILAAGAGDVLACATELAVARAVARGAFRGVLARGGDALAALAHARCVVVDKTETLTEGRARVVSIALTHGDEAALLADAARVAQKSDHPLANALVARAQTLGVLPAPCSEVRVLPGEGCLGELDGEPIALGGTRMLARLGVHDVTLEAKAEALRDHGQSVLFCVRGERVIGLFGLTYPVKLTTRDALRELEELGVRVVIASGDGARTTHKLAEQLDVPDAHGDLSPDQKRTLVEALRERGEHVCVAARDASQLPAVLAADVTIALGSDSRVESRAALQLFPTDLGAIARAFRLARELARSVAAQRSLARAGLALGALVVAGAACLGARDALPWVGLGWGAAQGVALMLRALAVASPRRDELTLLGRA